MSNARIEASYVWTSDDFLALGEAQILGNRGSFPRLQRVLIPAGIGIAGCVGVVLLFRGFPSPILGSALIVAALMLAWAASVPFREKIWRDALLKTGVQSEPGQVIAFSIDEEAVRMSMEGEEVSRAWADIPTVKEMEAGFLLDFEPSPQWLPLHAFARDGDRERFIAMAKRLLCYVPTDRAS